MNKAKAFSRLNRMDHTQKAVRTNSWPRQNTRKYCLKKQFKKIQTESQKNFLEKYNEKLEANGFEEEKIDLNDVNGLKKEKNKVNFYKNTNKIGNKA